MSTGAERHGDAGATLRKAFNALHISIRATHVSRLWVSSDGVNYDLQERDDSAHEKLERYAAVKVLEERADTFGRELHAAFPDQGPAFGVDWNWGPNPEYRFEMGGRRVFEAGKGRTDKLLKSLAFQSSQVAAMALPRRRRVAIRQRHQPWVDLVLRGSATCGSLRDRFSCHGIHLWDHVSIEELDELADQTFRDTHWRDDCGPILVRGTADREEASLVSDRSLPGCLDPASPCAQSVYAVVKSVYENLVLIEDLGDAIDVVRRGVLGARAVQSIALSIERRPGASIASWSFDQIEIQGGSAHTQHVIRESVRQLAETFEELVIYLNAGDRVDGRIEFNAERTGRRPIEQASLDVSIAGSSIKLNLDQVGVSGGVGSYSSEDVVWDTVGRVAAAIAMIDGPQRALYVTVQRGGSATNIARPVWAASAAHAAWIDIDCYINNDRLLGDIEVTAYCVDLDA